MQRVTDSYKNYERDNVFWSETFFNYTIILLKLFETTTPPYTLYYTTFIARSLIYSLFTSSKEKFFPQLQTCIPILCRTTQQTYLGKRFFPNDKYAFAIFLLFLVYKKCQSLNVSNLSLASLLIRKQKILMTIVFSIIFLIKASVLGPIFIKITCVKIVKYKITT